MKNDIIKIQSISDIITNSSSEVYLMDLNSVFDIEYFKLIGLYDKFTLFKEEKEVEDYFKKVVLNRYEDRLNLFGGGGNGGDPIFNGSLSLSAICYCLDTEKDSDCPKERRLTLDELWIKYRPEILEKLLGYGFIYYDRDYWFELTEKYAKEEHKLRYHLVKEGKMSIKDDIEFRDRFGNVLKLGRVVFMLALENNKPTVKIAQATDAEILEDGGYNVIFTIIKDGELTNEVEKIFIKSIYYSRIDTIFTHTPEIICWNNVGSEATIHSTLTDFYNKIKKGGYKKELIDKLYSESPIYGYLLS